MLSLTHKSLFIRRGAIAAVFALSLTTGAQATENSPASTTDAADNISVLPLEDLRVFTKAYDHIRSSYIKEIDDRTLLEYAIRGMLDELDPHSAFLDASSFDDLQINTTGEFGGLGIEVGMEDGFVRVISPIDDTPAARGGVEAGDLIIKLDDTSVKGLTLNDAVERMRGPKGSEITLTIVREGVEQPFELVLKRDIIKVKSVRSDILEDGFAYLRIAQFQMNTGADVEEEIKKLQKLNPKLKGMILDLRNNPGGVLQASVAVADLFIDKGMIVYTEGRLSDSNTKFLATPGDITNGLPLVVLINDGSASASEIVAGALQDQRRALVIGTRSFGKGSVQSVIPITEDRAVKLTTALYYTPNGRSIQAQGIAPDIEVERVKVTSLEPSTSLTEAGLSRHLENGNGKGDLKSGDRRSSSSELHSEDSQLYEALNILKGLNLFSRSQVYQAQKQTKIKSAANN